MAQVLTGQQRKYLFRIFTTFFYNYNNILAQALRNICGNTYLSRYFQFVHNCKSVFASAIKGQLRKYLPRIFSDWFNCKHSFCSGLKGQLQKHMLSFSLLVYNCNNILCQALRELSWRARQSDYQFLTLITVIYF